ncbi:prolipoprotein diacylglyceryl transferase [Candidatus Pacearchaeota archaeon]|nr:hypothetical protein [uncultured archaeon]AQS31866.1 hypothetical protein [uncultured archaeon]MBS3088563.1 prolipoprotein diacylglyceryl transferase [Candidatus Pacearchaeota archaeon]
MLSPIIFKIGSIQVSYYVLVYIAGFIATLFLLLHYKKELKLKPEQCYNLTFYLLVGVTLCARIFHIFFWGLDYYLKNPIKMIYIWQGGLSFHGGLIGAILVVFFFSKIDKINFFKLADLLSLPAVLAHAFQRISNLINQEIVGTITSSKFCMYFDYFDGCRHPVQIYASIGNFLLFFFLLFLYFKKPSRKLGLIFWLMIFLTGIGRFLLDFIREDAVYLGLKSGQWLSIPMIIIGAYVLIKYYKK